MSRFSVGLSEVALRVSDVAASIRFYCDIVGLRIYRAEPQAALLWAGAAGRQQWVILLHRELPPVHGRENVPGRPRPPAGSPFETMAPRDLGRTHFALHVPMDRLAEALAHVQAQGVEVYGPVDFGDFGSGHYFLDPDGHWVEFWTPGAASPPVDG